MSIIKINNVCARARIIWQKLGNTDAFVLQIRGKNIESVKI